MLCANSRCHFDPVAAKQQNSKQTEYEIIQGNVIFENCRRESETVRQSGLWFFLSFVANACIYVVLICWFGSCQKTLAGNDIALPCSKWKCCSKTCHHRILTQATAYTKFTKNVMFHVGFVGMNEKQFFRVLEIVLSVLRSKHLLLQQCFTYVFILKTAMATIF